MSRFNLKGKTVMVVADDQTSASSMQHSFESLGATVVYADRPLHEPFPLCEEVEQHLPKIDAVVVVGSNIKSQRSMDATLTLTRRLTAECPVIVSDPSENKLAGVQFLQEAGAKYFSMNPDEAAFFVAHTIAKHSETPTVSR